MDRHICTLCRKTLSRDVSSQTFFTIEEPCVGNDARCPYQRELQGHNPPRQTTNKPIPHFVRFQVKR